MSLLQLQLMLSVIIYAVLQIVYMNTWVHFLCGYRETDVKSLQLESQVEWDEYLKGAHRQLKLAKHVFELCFLRVKADPWTIESQRNCIHFSIKKGIILIG